MENTPQKIVALYKEGAAYKNSLGAKGMYEQNKINERFFAGDQWYGAFCGEQKPLVRHNLIKRIGDYKMGLLVESGVKISFLAEANEAFSNKTDSLDSLKELTENLNGYLASCFSRLRLNEKTACILRDSFITGTGVLYTYWDDSLLAKKGDIAVEVLSLEDVFFGDNSANSVEEQPYILLLSRRNTDSLKRAYADKIPASLLENIVPDCLGDGKKTTVYTKLYKTANDDGSVSVKAVCCTEKIMLRSEYDTYLTRYPINIFVWDNRKNRIFGESEITHLIPNQIAINRMVTASVWASMSMGMPIMTVNGDTVTGNITNDPGQIIKVYGTNEDVAGAIHYVSPPDFSENFSNGISDLIENTLETSGVGELLVAQKRYNTNLEVQSIKNSSGISMHSLKNRYLYFLEDVALVFADFWVNKYGRRTLRAKTDNGEKNFIFDAEKLRNVYLSASAEYLKEEL